MIQTMDIKVLRNKEGILSGLIIPMEQLAEAKASLKEGSELYSIINDLLNDQKTSGIKRESLLAGGRTVFEVEKETQVITDKLYADAFEKGLSMYYKDGRTTAPTEFIRANPDGSEDLVSFDTTKREYTLLKKLVPKGQGHWSYLTTP